MASSERTRDGSDVEHRDRQDAVRTDDEADVQVERPNSYGISITLISGVLLALGYYGVLGLRGGRPFGALPEPFYLLAVAFLFVVELLKSRQKGWIALVRASAFAAVFGVLVALAVEGSVLLWERPDVALANFEGVTVLAVTLVVAALSYFTYLSAIQADRRHRID